MNKNENHIHHIAQFRQNMRKTSRRQFLQEKFALKRKQVKQQNQKAQEENFTKIMNLMDQEQGNYFEVYEKHKQMLVRFSYSQLYCFRLLNLSFIMYEIFLKNPNDDCALEILKNMCFYQEIQIPQTQQFAQTLKNLFFQKHLNVAQLLFYLTKNCKYGLFCARLVDKQIIPILGQTLYNAQMKYSEINQKQAIFTAVSQKQQINHFIFQILSIVSSLFTIQPILNLFQLEQIADIFNLNHQSSLAQYYMFFVGKTLQKVAKEFEPQNKIAQLILSKFENFIQDMYKYVDQQQICLDIIQYFWKSQVLLPSHLICIILQGFKSHSKENKIQLLKLLKKFIQIKMDEMEVQTNQIIDFSKIPSFLQFNSMFQSKKTKKMSYIDKQNQKNICKELLEQKHFNQIIRTTHISQDSTLKQIGLELLLNIIELLLSNSVLQEQPYQTLSTIYTQQQFIILLVESLSNESLKQRELAINIISMICSFLKQQQQLQSLTQLKNVLQGKGIIKQLQNVMYAQNNKNILFESQNIINILYH